MAEILEEEHGDCRLAVWGLPLATHIDLAHHQRRGGQGEPKADDQGCAPVETEAISRPSQHGRTGEKLHEAPAEDGLAHLPQATGAEL